MSDKQLADVICRALLAIVAAIRKRYDLPVYHGVTISVTETFAPKMEYTSTPNSSTITK